MRAIVNPTHGKCWGRLSRCLGYCEKNHRPGMLTCWFHRDSERAAQELHHNHHSQVDEIDHEHYLDTIGG